jgi:hypothetical protein
MTNKEHYQALLSILNDREIAVRNVSAELAQIYPLNEIARLNEYAVKYKKWQTAAYDFWQFSIEIVNDKLLPEDLYRAQTA